MSSTTNVSNPGRGYGIALISAAVFSTTAIFVRYLTQTYRLPALVLAGPAASARERAGTNGGAGGV